MRLILVLTLACIGCVAAAEDRIPKLSTLGKPTEIRKLPNGETVHFFPQQPWGHATYAARYNGGGKLISYGQILTEKNIAKVVKDKTKMKEVRDLLGPPWQPETYPLSKITTWTYTMRIAGDPNPKWFVVQMSSDGMVRDTKLMNDPQFDQPWGHRRR